uniref:FBD domain-containing protein n=1 Tax=Triticum urartu TaxID=4572 RepID=A0A8R7P807_TRIUA
MLPSPPQTPQPPPAAAFRFSDTLCVATIGDCHLTDSTIQPLHFPKLQKLALKRVGISESSLHTMIAGCPALQCLLIYRSFGFGRLRINSINLRGICVKAYSYGRGLKFGELIIENAPFLGSLILSDRLHVSLIYAPKLEALGFLSSTCSSVLAFDSAVIQGLHVDSMTTAVRTIKILAVDMHALSLDVVLDLMRCFPSLEKLYIQSTGPGKSNCWRRKHRDLIRSLDIRLKTIVWRHYRGIKSHVDFATFFVLNAGVLELMTFEVNSEDYNEEFFAQHRKMLQVDNRASRGARFRFTSDWSYNHIMESSVHDLDPADPFERTCPSKENTNFVLCAGG